MYRLKLTHGRSYFGFHGGEAIAANKDNPEVLVKGKAAADAAIASGHFALVGEEDAPAELLKGHLDRAQLEEMKLDDLKKLAADLGIDTKGLSKKAEFVEAIAATEVEAPAPTTFEEALNALSEEELKAFAGEHEISLEGCETREDIIEAISVANGGSYTMLDLMRQ